MFDGNYRTGRRTVNLGGRPQRKRRGTAGPSVTSNGGGGGTTSGAVGRAAILETSARLRQERKIATQRERAARRIQPWVRGNRARREAVRNLLLEIQRLQQEGNSTNAAASASAAAADAARRRRLTSRWNALLGCLTPRELERSREAYLQQYCQSLSIVLQPEQQTVLAHRIVRATLTMILRTAAASEPLASTTLDCATTILTFCLPPEAKDAWLQVGGNAGFLSLMETLQFALVSEEEQLQDQWSSLTAILWQWFQHITAAVQRQQEEKQRQDGNNHCGHLERIVCALEGSFALLSPEASRLMPRTAASGNGGLQGEEYMKSLLSVLSSPSSSTTTTAPPAQGKQQPAQGAALVTALQQLVSRHGMLLVVRILERQQQSGAGAAASNNTGTLMMTLLLVQELLGRQQSGSTASMWCLVGWCIRGKRDVVQSLASATAQQGKGCNKRALQEQIASLLGPGQYSQQLMAANPEDQDDDDDDFMEEEDAETTSTRATAPELPQPRARPGQRRELQTTSRMDRLYHQEWKSALQQTTQGLAKTKQQSLSEMARLAGYLSDPGLWLQWASALLVLILQEPANANAAAAQRQQQGTAVTAVAAARAYVGLFSVVLQAAGCTGWKVVMGAQFLAVTSFMSKLVVSTNDERQRQEPPLMICLLWNLVQFFRRKQECNTSQSLMRHQQACCIFGDVYSHALIAMRDAAFLDTYTTAGQQGNEHGKKILATDIMEQYRGVLLDLYWTRPVQQSEIIDAATAAASNTLEGSVRGRLFLSATKCWNAIYERYTRFVRHYVPFCEESAWLFPEHVLNSLAAATGRGNALLNQPAAAAAAAAAAPMDYEEEDSDVEMEQAEDSNDNRGDNGGGDVPMAVEEGGNTVQVDAETEALAGAFRDPKMARILTAIPQAVPFGRRVQLFDALITTDKNKTQDESTEMRQAMIRMMRGQVGGDGEDDEDDLFPGRARVEIHRDLLYSDSMEQLNKLGSKLRRKVQVAFINQHGTAEAGIDGGGVFKEFMSDLMGEAFSVQPTEEKKGKQQGEQLEPFFVPTPLQTLTVNASLGVAAASQDAAARRQLDEHYEFLGRVLGKAVYESILVESQFSLPFLNQLLGKQNTLEDLKNFDPEYYQNLTKLLTLPAHEMDALGLTFEINLPGSAAAGTTMELMPGGRSKPVTARNVAQYVHTVAHARLNVMCARQVRAFLRGFRDLIPAPWIRLFSAHELQKVVSGDGSPMDVAALQEAVVYAAGYFDTQPVILWFWQVVREMTGQEQGMLLKFITSCSRPPLLGFASLEPAICIQKINLPKLANGATAPLPTASTCMNLLKLPNYPTKELLRYKLMAAISAGAGFELT